MPGGLVVGGEVVSAFAGLYQDVESAVPGHLVAGPPVVVGEPVEVAGPEFLDGLRQAGVESAGGDGGQSAGGDFLDEGVGEAVHDVRPLVLLDHQSGFDQSSDDRQQVDGVHVTGALQEVMGQTLGAVGDQFDGRALLGAEEVQAVDHQVLDAAGQGGGAVAGQRPAV